MSQNAMHLSWTAQEVDEKLHQIMHNIHEQLCKNTELNLTDISSIT